MWLILYSSWELTKGARICSLTFARQHRGAPALPRAPSSNRKTSNTSFEEIYEPAGLTPLCSVPQGASTAPAFIFFSAWRVPLVAINAAWHRTSKGAGANFSSPVPHGEEGQGSSDRCTHRCTARGQMCPLARGRALGEEMQTPTVVSPPIPAHRPPYIL